MAANGLVGGEDSSPTIDLAWKVAIFCNCQLIERDRTSRARSQRRGKLTKTFRVWGERERLEGEAIALAPLFSLFAASRASLTLSSSMWVRNRLNGVGSSCLPTKCNQSLARANETEPWVEVSTHCHVHVRYRW